MKNNLKATLKKWYEGHLTFDEMHPDPIENIPVEHTHSGKEKYVHRKRPEISHNLENTEIKLTRKLSGVFSALFCAIFIAVLVATVNFIPGFAYDDSPTVNEVYEHYVGEGRDETGAVNTVAGMILEYRAFDTLGESFVLFTACCAVFLLLGSSIEIPLKKRETFSYSDDPIIKFAVKILTPIIVVFGIYILFNGHISPGGGFSGGAILGTGLILFAMAYGEEKAAKVIPEKFVNTVIIISLSFYCLSKSYSFFTGNEFNGLHSIISPGTPGDILSGGLILPLNVAVGLVVCCTMYSFYMIFKRGRLN